MICWLNVDYLEQYIGLVWRDQVSLEGCAQNVAQPIDLQLLSVIGTLEQTARCHAPGVNTMGNRRVFSVSGVSESGMVCLR